MLVFEVYFCAGASVGVVIHTPSNFSEGASALQDQNKLSQSQKRAGLKKLLKCVYVVNKPPN